MKQKKKLNDRIACNLKVCRPEGIEQELLDEAARLDGSLRKKASVYKALSAEARVKILNLLIKRPLCGCEIIALLGLGQSTISHHLSVLKKAGLIVAEKKEKWNNYYLSHDLNKKLSPF